MIHTSQLNAHIYYKSIHTQFIIYTQSQSQWYNPKVASYNTSWIIYTLPMNYAIHTTTQLFSKSFYLVAPQSDSTRRVPTVDPIAILVAQKLVALKGSYNCVIAQFITHNSIHTTSQYTCISPFITCSICHLLTIWITIS